MSTMYKVLVNDKSAHGGDFDWSDYMPKGKKPGKWTPTVESVQVCNRGWHLTTEPMAWAKWGMRIFEAEGKGASDPDGNKTAFASVRLIRDVTVDVAPDYWRQVEAFVAELPTWPWMKPQGDPDPSWNVFDTRDAARAATRDAARDAARAAPWAAPWDAARDAAWVAAWAAAWDAAEAAAWVAARAAAWDAALESDRIIAGDRLDKKHADHIQARLDVWRRGYGLLYDVDGVLYVYRSVT